VQIPAESWLPTADPARRRVRQHGGMVERALSFGTVATAYERFRLGYPDELVDEVLAYAGQPVRTALEVGAGTGKATRVFAARGIAVTATDPDSGMLAELRRHVPGTVATVQGAFEELPLTATYDLVFAAASFHWTKAEGRWDRVAALLEPGGVFASLGGNSFLADPQIEEVVRATRTPYLAEDDVPSPDGTPEDAPLRWPGTELEQSALFADVRQSVLVRRPRVSADFYVGHLGTVSAYLQLDAPVRERVLREIREVLPPQVTIAADLTLHVARLR
jgi:SAM-dependent methyltransferase